MNRLEVLELSVDRGGRRILSGLSFALAAGDLIVLSGPNGAGKSTLLRAVAGLLPLADGAVRWLPQDQPLAESCHYFGHLDGLKPALTVAENLALWSKVAGARGLSVGEALERIGLDALEDLPAAYLSSGQKRRVGFARLLLTLRPLWLLDEPTSALDIAAEAAFGSILAEHLAGGGAAIVATHRRLPVAATAELALRPETGE
ncbi:heme ABC exporter ATP-binding protein CcmA [Kaistia algarum]|uniref:heme ABC exporter ATP-binding protein CcmA n=1 Tax=Kaistia algarum TaxID=2083279 RepID=UPI0022560A36|nr:heme ABC exporter ATP-binding protein CcmA [Kaistia algarum]MCX5514083.1 heme ABC exporter ATP-binding protein CcmA [Kaistia algarum]